MRLPRIVTPTSSLQALYPDIAAEWHPTRNGPLTPEQVTPGSDQKVWWRCRTDPSHEWQATIGSRTAGSGCPMCAGQRVTPTTSLQELYPTLAAEWHPTNNGVLTPEQVRPGSGQKVWWRCGADPSHEWQAVIANRTGGRGCPVCAGQRVTPTTSLQALYPTLAAEWHPTNNGTLTPEQVRPGSGQKVWWRCGADPSHEWQTAVNNRTQGRGCPMCAGKIVTPTTSLQALYPDLAAEWHPTNNGSLTPEEVTPGSGRKVWWRCRTDPSHEWQATVDHRGGRGSGCPMCTGQRVTPTTSLQALYPTLATEWHPTNNGALTPDQVRPGSSKKVWWRCRTDLSHEWQTKIVHRTAGSGCPLCAGQWVTPSTSLQALYPTLAAEWHPTRNDTLTPDQVRPGSEKKVWWRCRIDPSHEWQATVVNRAKGRGCPMCAGRRVTPTTSLQALYPALAVEWHPTANGALTPDQVRPGSNKKVWWRCGADPSHEWRAVIASRTRGNGCPMCDGRWTLEAIRRFVASLKDYLDSFTPAELYLLFQQNGLLDLHGKGKAFVKALATGRFPQEELQKFVEGRSSLVDTFVEDPTQTLQALAATEDVLTREGQTEDTEDVDSLVNEPIQSTDDATLPLISAKKILTSLDAPVVTSADEEAVGFLLESAKAKLWKHVFHDEEEAITQLEDYAGGDYSARVRADFLTEYHASKSLDIPRGYAFSLEQGFTPPNLMQRLTAVRLAQRHRIGNWSGTGAGKTLSAVLAGRVVGATFTVICCPNAVVEGWQETILDVFHDSLVATKTFTPDWSLSSHDDTGIGAAADPHQHRYLILNYEAFQQPDSQGNVALLAANEKIDFVVVDEIHYAKQRHIEDMSKRKQMVMALLSLAVERNPALYVLGMSATPVINNLQEGKSLVELVTGASHDDLDTRATVPNCMRLHQQLVSLGTRWLPDYDIICDIQTPEVDCSPFLEDIRALGKNGTPLALEQILTRARLPLIRKAVEPKTLIYTHYIQGIEGILRQALQEDGWKVGFYTGEDKRGLAEFLAGDLDVLIGSSAVGTGLDGLQKVCHKLIINVLPWTHAEFEQLKGRVYRQGQIRDHVNIVIPITYADINGSRWSWCESKLQRLRFKQSIADAAVDGVVPEGHLRTPAQAYQDVLGWLERLTSGQIAEITRPRIVVPLPDDDKADVSRRRRRYGDFSTMNRRWNQTHSQETHARLQENPEEWQHYHTLYQERRKDWAVIPYDEIIRWCQRRSDYVIGDFGCGEAQLAAALAERHTVMSFDHVAINPDVIACNMAHVPLDDETLDVAVFSLSLMGSNCADYLREAYRTLKLDGALHIIEATSRFQDRAGFTTGLKHLGFSLVEMKDVWKFTHIYAIKTENPPRDDFQLRF